MTARECQAAVHRVRSICSAQAPMATRQESRLQRALFARAFMAISVGRNHWIFESCGRSALYSNSKHRHFVGMLPHISRCNGPLDRPIHPLPIDCRGCWQEPQFRTGDEGPWGVCSAYPAARVLASNRDQAVLRPSAHGSRARPSLPHRAGLAVRAALGSAPAGRLCGEIRLRRPHRLHIVALASCLNACLRLQMG